MPAELTIEQLAAQSGMSVRNIRAHQARGLLAPPEVRLRVGYYGPEHVERLALIRDLQDDGFNLTGIKRLLDGRDRFEVPSPSLLVVAERVVARGVSLDGVLAVFEEIERHCDAVSGSFVKLFLDEVWQPFQAAGMPVQRRPEIEQSIDALRPLATEALLAIFGQRMSGQIEAAFGQLGQRLTSPGDNQDVSG